MVVIAGDKGLNACGAAQVFERSQAYRECGAGITVDVNGMKAVKAVDSELCSRLEAIGVDFGSFEEFDQYGGYLQFVA